jgi:uncharacterized protein involved in outer membrane biogenesis
LKALKMKNPDLFLWKDFISINNIAINVNVSSLWKDTIGVEEIVLDVDDLTMVTSGEGESNYTILVKILSKEIKRPLTKSQMHQIPKNIARKNEFW